MKRNANRLTVIYGNGAVRTRQVQTTVYPTAAELGPVRTINAWYEYVRFMTDLPYRATHAIDTIVATDQLVDDAKQILYGSKT